MKATIQRIASSGMLVGFVLLVMPDRDVLEIVIAMTLLLGGLLTMNFRFVDFILELIDIRNGRP